LPATCSFHASQCGHGRFDVVARDFNAPVRFFTEPWVGYNLLIVLAYLSCVGRLARARS
jgi:hypothetical protein